MFFKALIIKQITYLTDYPILHKPNFCFSCIKTET